MITEDKIKEVRRQLKKGIPEGEVKLDMERAGYSPEDIAKVFAPHEYDMRSWYLIFSILIFLVGLWLFMDRGSLLLLILSALLFLQYLREGKRLKALRENK